MAPYDVVLVVILSVGITFIIAGAICDQRLWRLRQENRLLRRLLSEQAQLSEMSLNAYIAMFQEAQRHTRR